MTTKEDFLSHFLKKKSSQTEVDLKILYEEMMDKGEFKEAKRLRDKADEYGYCIEVCPLCDGTGKKQEYYNDEDSHETYENGFTKCINCQ